MLIHADIENNDSLTKIVQKLDDALYTDLEIRSRILNSLMVYPHSLDSKQFNDDFIDKKGNPQINNTLINSASDIKGREGRS